MPSARDRGRRPTPRARLAALAVGLLVAAGGAAADADWQLLRAPGFWEKQFGGVLDAHDGWAWYRCFVRVPADWQGQTLQLKLGKIDDCDETFFNGTRIGGRGTREPYRTASGETRQYAVAPQHVRFGGYNLIAVRVWDGGGAGGISEGPLTLEAKAEPLELRGQWQFRTGDDLAWAQWPHPPDSGEGAKLAADFAQAAGRRFGTVKTPVAPEPLSGTQALRLQGDLASHLVAGVDQFLLRETAQSVARREKFWRRDCSSALAYSASISPNRQRLARILGVREARVSPTTPELVGTPVQPALVGKGSGYEVFAVRWRAFGDVHGEGLLLVPTGGARVADLVAIPDATQTPEEIAGLAAGVPPESQFARRLAESGCRVLVPVLIDRQTGQAKSAEGNRGAGLSNREFLYRSAFELGRHLIGYELQKVLAGIDWFSAERSSQVGVVGWGEGGMLALYAGALDPRIDAVCVSGHFERREDLWQEPIDRNVFGLLEQFGDAELAAMVAPRTLVVEAARGPAAVVPPGTGGGPGRLRTPPLADVRAEVERAQKLVAGLAGASPIQLVVSGEGTGPYGSPEALGRLLAALAPEAKLAPSGTPPTYLRAGFDPQVRHRSQMRELDRHSQQLLMESPYVRQRFMAQLDASSPEKYQQTVEVYRRLFYEEVIGRFEAPLLPPNVRSRKAYDEEAWTGYEVVLDVFPDVLAYGILAVPKDVKSGDRRPVVVCQHGLEGRPQDTIGEAGFQYYKAFTARLAERGFVTFAPQNLYIFTDRFRSLQRKANPLKKTLFSIIVPQHQQITDWLKSLPYVDPDRIAFYGLSYGGKTAMRVPPLVGNYCLSICSADFNEWVWKNASTLSPYSYVWTGEYEIFEFDLGSTFNYAEMAALIAPRPFMVERGHFDGVAPDETVGYEFAKVRFLYEARLGLGDRCAIEWFTGPHTINGKGTFDFLHRHLNWPVPAP